MHRLTIRNLGPIEDCNVEFPGLSVYTGFQASGKSTIAKSVFYFRTIKEDIIALSEEIALGVRETEPEESGGSFSRQLLSRLRFKFLNTFGSSWAMHPGMYLEYRFTETFRIAIRLMKDGTYPAPNYIWFDLSPAMESFLRSDAVKLYAGPLGVSGEQKEKLRDELERQFDDPYESVYIPAGRSMLTLLSEQLSYIYSTMRDSQKRTIDHCTRDYIERILRVKPEFSNGMEGLLEFSPSQGAADREAVALSLSLIRKILRGRYVYSGGEERIEIDDSRFVKLNFASSGQQESVWILNLLFYYLVQRHPVFLIIEEPESNLFPESQKYISELIALAANHGHSALITTHSPYVLGTLNNLLYAGQQPEELTEAAGKVIPRQLWISGSSFDARFVANGTAENCLDAELHMVQNERIDEISDVINQDFDAILALHDSAGHFDECPGKSPDESSGDFPEG